MNKSNVVDIPLKIRRGISPWEDGSSRCPYCLEKLKNQLDEPSSKAKPPLGPSCLCPICRHDIPTTILGVPPHAFNRAQEWDFLENEIHYLIRGLHFDLDWYLFAQGEFFNPDYKDAKDRYVGILYEKDALLRLREEFLEAEGELETLMVQYLRKRLDDESGLAKLLLSGDKWRQWARGLSAEGAGPRLVAEFQLDYVRNLFWAVFESLGEHNKTIRFLKDRLDQLK